MNDYSEIIHFGIVAKKILCKSVYIAAEIIEYKNLQYLRDNKY